MSIRLINRDDRGPVAVFTLDRPLQRNALSRALLAQLRDGIDKVSVDEKIRAVVLTGAGVAFCTGMDLKEAAAMDAAADAEVQTIATLEEFADLLQRMHALPKPTVAAVNGDALAGGAGLMMACDLAIAAETARIGYPEVKRGLVAAIIMHDLTRQVGDRRARELLLGGEPISSKVAHDWGLVNRVTPNDACLHEAIVVAEELAQSGPKALALTKRLLDEAAGRPHDLRGAAAVSGSVRLSPEAQEGIHAFVEKRWPAWAWSRAEEGAP
jgi:methylglutaconyl-CoA hydratase